MQNTIFNLYLALLFLTNLAWANEPRRPEISTNFVKMTIHEPQRNVGYFVGDILTRSVILEVKSPYRLIETTLPIVGYEKRYRGQVIGVELRDIQYKKNSLADGVRYQLSLKYQVFTNSPTAKPVFLPREVIQFQGKDKTDLVQLTIPVWMFRVSPLAIFGAVKIEDDMSDFYPLFLQDNHIHRQRLWLYIGLLGFSTLGLIYILGKRAWLPRMGKPFAKAYLRIHKLSASEANIHLSLEHIHRAFDQSAGINIFQDNNAVLLSKVPQLETIKNEIQHFFVISQQVFYEDKLSSLNLQETLQWLKLFCLRCRDCERGLK